MPATAGPSIQAELDIVVPEVEVVPDPPAVYELDTDLRARLVQQTSEQARSYWYHHDADDIVSCITATHQEQLLVWGGFNHHCPIPLQHDGLTSAERHVLGAQDDALRADAQALQHRQDTEVYIPNLCVFNSTGHPVADHGEAIFQDKCGETLFENMPSPLDKRRKKELTLQVGLFQRKLDPISAKQQAASNMYDRPTDANIQRSLERCVYWRSGAYCTCSICTDTRQRTCRRVTAQWREGQPVNRVIRNAYSKGGFPEPFIKRVDNYMSALGEVWSRRDRILYVTVSCLPEAFLRLGNRDHTKGDGSCYRDGGEWEGAKHALMSAPNSCVYYFYKSDDFDVDCDVNESQPGKPVARAWGYWTPGQLVAATNFYGLPQRELRLAMSMLAEAELCKAPNATKQGQSTTTAFFTSLRNYQYLNSDTLLWSNGPKHTKRIRKAAEKAVMHNIGVRDVCRTRESRYEGDFYDEEAADKDWINLTDIDAELAAPQP